MTDPTGRSFLSYSRGRSHEAELLIAAQKARGVPTWQDISDLEDAPTEQAIRQMLADPATANVVLWITPEVASSAFIRNVEVPLINDRVKHQDGFFALTAAAGGLDYGPAAEIAGIKDIAYWNMRKVDDNPIDYASAGKVADLVLTQRLRTIHRSCRENAPLLLSVSTRDPLPFLPGVALQLDWSSFFRERTAIPGAWDASVLPALRELARNIKAYCPTRSLIAEGFVTLSVATALGAAFVAPKGIDLTWRQRMQDGSLQNWSLSQPEEISGFQTSITWRDTQATDIAVLISVSEDVNVAFTTSESDLPPFRAVLTVSKDGSLPHSVATPGQATHLANLAVQSARSLRTQVRSNGRIHLFLAGPAGLAVLVGQLLNTLGPIQTYEHHPVDMVGRYVSGVSLNAGL